MRERAVVCGQAADESIVETHADVVGEESRGAAADIRYGNRTTHLQHVHDLRRLRVDEAGADGEVGTQAAAGERGRRRDQRATGEIDDEAARLDELVDTFKVARHVCE